MRGRIGERCGAVGDSGGDRLVTVTLTKRLAVTFAVCICLLGGISSVITYALATSSSAQRSDESNDETTATLRAACERASDSRVSTFHFLRDIIRASAEVSSPKILGEFRADLSSFVQSQKDVAVAPGAMRPNGVRADCARAYPS